MRPLVVDDVARQKVKRIVDYALDPKHWYRPGKSRVVPGNDAHFVAHLNTYRCVFTITQQPDGFAHRHLSISVPSDNFPHIAAAYTIAELFGFFGWDGTTIDALPPGWMAHVSHEEHCIVLAQPYEAKVSA